MAEAQKAVVLISSFFQVSSDPSQRRWACLSCVCTVWPGREDSSLPQRSQYGLCWSGIPHQGSTQELHHTVLEIGKLHKGKTLNQESAEHCNIYRHDSCTSSVTANPGKVWNDSLSLSLRKCNVLQPGWLWKAALPCFGPQDLSGFLKKLNKPQCHNLAN